MSERTGKKPCIVFQTDFGLGGGGAMYGVCKQVDAALQPCCLTHTIPSFDVRRASASLRDALPSWPVGTVFVSVVDPGVGTDRRACVAHTRSGYYIVTPDNGTLTDVADTFGIDAVREIDESVNRYHGTEKVSIFHGRDLFAYCAARLASGVIDFAGVGPAYPAEDIVTFAAAPYRVESGAADGCITGGMEAFGNLDTSIPSADFARAHIPSGATVRLEILHGGEMVFAGAVRYYQAFAAAQPGQEILYDGFAGFVGIAINRGNFAQTYHIGCGSDWLVRIRKEG